MTRKRTKRANVHGGDPDCIHHFVMDQPKWVGGTHYFREHGVCKKCGAVTDYLRPEYSEFEDPIVLADDLQEGIPHIGYENNSGDAD